MTAGPELLPAPGRVRGRTTLVGKALFDPGLEKIYRVASYAVIAAAVLTGLPLFD